MLITRHGFSVFNEYDLWKNLRSFASKLKSEVESDGSIRTADEEAYVEEKVTLNTIQPLVLHTDKITVTQQEVDIPASFFPSASMHSRFDGDSGQTYSKPVITFHIPFAGNAELLHCQPSSRLMWSEDVAIEGSEILFDIINFNNDAEAVKKGRDELLKNLQANAEHVNKEVAVHNTNLKQVVRTAFQTAKGKFAFQDDVLSQLGNPPRS